MKKTALVLSTVLLGVLTVPAHSGEQDGHAYLGLGISSLGLDEDRIPGVPTTSPGHTPKIGQLIAGYQFNSRWALDLSIGADFSSNPDTTEFAINGYRFFTDNKWRPFVSVGANGYSIDDASKKDTSQMQVGLGVSGDLTDKLEFRAGYQHSFTLSEPSYNDDAFILALNWHFRKPRAEAAPAPQPESVPKKKEVVDTYELKVLFDFDKATIKSSYKPQFDEIAAVLKDSPEIDMTIEGHTDWTGTEQYNQGLSERRAEAVKQKFVNDYGISPDRITTIGYGESRPIADNKTREGRQQNRRAIAVILKKRIVTE